jgi:probable phosphoglycerate mutase
MNNESQIYIVRHGQTEFNTKGIAQGHSDSPLTEKGMADAVRLGRGLQGTAFDAVYSSDLGRAQHTAGLILEGMGVNLPVITEPGLKERCLGSLEGKKSHGCLELALNHARQAGIKDALDMEFLLAAYETPGDSSVEKGDVFVARIKNALKNIAAASLGKRVLCVSHGFSIWAMIYIVTNDKYVPPYVDNLSVTVITGLNDGLYLKSANDMSYYKRGLNSSKTGFRRDT